MADQIRSSRGIGASEIAAACGISRYRTPLGLWLEKTGRAPTFAGNVHTRLGQLCEPRARQLYADATGRDVEIPTHSVFHPEIPWARCTPDGRWVDDPGVKVQIKCVGYFVGRRWRYQIPLEIEAQCQWELFVDGGHRNDLAVLVGSDELEWERFLLGEITDPAAVFDAARLEIYTIQRDDDAIAALFAGAEKLWRMIESDTQPEIDASPECARWLTGRRGPTSELALEYADHMDLVDEWRAAHEAKRTADDRLDLVKNRIRELLATAEASRIATPDGPAIWTRTANGGGQLRTPPGWNQEEH